MKNTITKMLLILLFLLFSFQMPAFSQENTTNGLSIENGWVSGRITGSILIGNEHQDDVTIKVDCPLPSDAYPTEILVVSDRYISKKEMQNALKAAGQNINGKFVNTRGLASFSGDWNAKAAANITKEEATAQAIKIALLYFDALKVEVDPVPYSISRPYDYEDYMTGKTHYYEHRYSDASRFIDNAQENWKKTSKYHPKQSEYTSLSFYILLDGMKLSSFTSYPAGYDDEPEAWIGVPVCATAVVSDSGILVEASCNLLQIEKKKPAKKDTSYAAFIRRLHERYEHEIVSAENWQDALQAYVSNLNYRPQMMEQPYQNRYMDQPIIQYGSERVITKIYPVLYTIAESEWAPFWKIETQEEFLDGWRN